MKNGMGGGGKVGGVFCLFEDLVEASAAEGVVALWGCDGQEKHVEAD